MTRHAIALTTMGMVRKRNEDCAAIDGQFLQEGTPTMFPIADSKHLLLVADGMGGHTRGEAASALAIQALNERAADMNDPCSCINAVRAANRDLYEAMSRDKSLRGMGTTVVGVVIQRSNAIWFNVGDSRAYLFRKTLHRLTTDHVPPQDKAPFGPRSHGITQSLGGHYKVIDVWPAAGEIEVVPGDVMLMCTDGLTDLLPDDEIRGILSQNAPQSATQTLIDAALRRGAPDNITVIVALL